MAKSAVEERFIRLKRRRDYLIIATPVAASMFVVLWLFEVMLWPQALVGFALLVVAQAVTIVTIDDARWTAGAINAMNVLAMVGAILIPLIGSPGFWHKAAFVVAIAILYIAVDRFRRRKVKQKRTVTGPS